MNSTTQQDQLEIVSALAASLADRMLMERLTQGTLPLANASRLWTASLLLEEHERPIPRIVADVLEQVRHVEPAEAPERMDLESELESGPEPRPEPLPDVTAERHAGAAAPRRRRLTRLLRPFRQGTEA
ncbi:hypothetical protein A3862_11390 [Methylobacterium sp. XJLW]|jgi:hypothetical protein|uniref:Protein of unassigned function n=2 Tax=Methylobacterium TaxID=407 RepID=A0A089NWM9_9HYPH|nr:MULTISPECIES: hypothetical protein [Methylobacterium]AIQ92326.1 protein of unassigned function [Methylobacterium oryzae CBMB20]AWV16031.1 hypothetical protein A3862_11390 [Methylobacterium sp. XJLW]MBA9064860.1 hypothetical protein [Methylobacterium fujisawaense]